MPRQVVLLSGPIASGKTTLVQALVDKYAFHAFKTRQLIQTVKNVKSERGALQRAGDLGGHLKTGHTGSLQNRP